MSAVDHAAAQPAGAFDRDGNLPATRLLVVATVAPMVRAFLLPFADHFRGRGWRVDVAAAGSTACTDCTQHFDCAFEIPWSRSPLQPANWMRPPRLVRDLVAAQQYDLVHVHSPVAAFVTRWALRGMRRSGRPAVVYTAHGFHFHRYGRPWKNRLFAAAERLAGKWTDELIVMNREDFAAARRLRLAAPEHLTYMPGIGVQLDQYDPRSISDDQVRMLRAELNLADDAQIVLMVAEFIPRKRHRDLIEALSYLRRSNVHLLLAGNGPLISSMRRFAAQKRLASQVHFLGMRRDVPVLMRSAAALVLPSVQEGLPRAVMEAMCLETPVIGSQIRGTEELLEQQCGMLFPVGDTQQLAAHMAWILDHPAEARAMARRARGRMAEYSLENVVQQHEQVYARALRHSSPGPAP